MSCLEIGVPGKCHYIMLAQSLPEPTDNGCPADVMKGSFVHTGQSQYLLELLCEVIDHFVPRSGECPLAFRT